MPRHVLHLMAGLAARDESASSRPGHSEIKLVPQMQNVLRGAHGTPASARLLVGTAPLLLHTRRPPHCYHALTHLLSCTGKKLGKALLGADEPALWYEALASMPPLPDAGSAAPLTPEQVEEKRAVAEQAMEAEAAAFEQAYGTPSL